jgi:hypothetical protein
MFLFSASGGSQLLAKPTRYDFLPRICFLFCLIFFKGDKAYFARPWQYQDRGCYWVSVLFFNYAFFYVIRMNLPRSLRKKPKPTPSVAKPVTASARKLATGQKSVAPTLKREPHTPPTRSQTSDNDVEEIPAASGYSSLLSVARNFVFANLFLVVALAHVHRAPSRSMPFGRSSVQLGEFSLATCTGKFDLPSPRVKMVLL